MSSRTPFRSARSLHHAHLSGLRGAFRTIQAAIDFVADNFEYRSIISGVTSLGIRILPGEYNGNIEVGNTLLLQPSTAYEFFISGSGAGSTIINGSFIHRAAGVSIDFSNLTVNWPTNQALLAFGGGAVINLNGTIIINGYVRSSSYGFIYSRPGTNITVNANNLSNLIATDFGRIAIDGGGGKLVLNGANPSGGATCMAYNIGFIDIYNYYVNNNDISGNATGTRYRCYQGGGIDTNGGGPNIIPGTAAGVVTAGNYGWYN